jgi:hypothetical protein
VHHISDKFLGICSCENPQLGSHFIIHAHPPLFFKLILKSCLEGKREEERKRVVVLEGREQGSCLLGHRSNPNKIQIPNP